MKPETTPSLPQCQSFASVTSTPRAPFEACLENLEACAEMVLTA